MKPVQSVLVGFALIATVVADYATDVRINQTYVGFMQQFESLVNKTSYETSMAAYAAQQKALGSSNASSGYSLEQMLALSNNVTGTVMAKYKPIAYKLIYDAGYNTYGEYYILNRTTNVWHLPNQAAPSKPVNGTAVNSQILGKKLEDAFVQLMPLADASSGLQKRFFGRIITSAKANAFVRNIEPLPPTQRLDHIEAFKEKGSIRIKDKSWMENLEKATKDQNDWRQGASADLQTQLNQVDETHDYYARKQLLETKKAELQKKDVKADSDKKDIDIIQKELGLVNGLIGKELGQMFKWRITRFISLFFM